MERGEAEPQEKRLLVRLERLLGLEALGPGGAFQQAAQAVAEVLAADKVDVFLHEPAAQHLVATGVSDTPMARRQQTLGLDRLPLAGGSIVCAFRTGTSHRRGTLTGNSRS